MLDTAGLLAETAEQPPCGPDLEYDPAFRALLDAATERPEQQFGSTLIAAQEPKWAEVRDLAVALLARSKDLRAATLLTRALVQTEGFSALQDGLEIIRGLIERYWDEVHPCLDPDDDNDPTIRMSALAPLVDPGALIKDIRGALVLPSRAGGGLKVRDIEVGLGRMPARRDEEAVSQRQVEAMISTAALEMPEAIERIRGTLVSARALADGLAERVGAERAPDFKPLLSILSMLDQLCKAHVPALAVASGGAAADSAETGDTRTRVAETMMTGEIRSREEALKMIDKVIDYFERNEPTNPAPLLIKRARRLVSMNFVDIIKDMAPDSLKQIESIAGPRANE